jgi:hypothetical protein
LEFFLGRFIATRTLEREWTGVVVMVVVGFDKFTSN